MQHNVLCYGEYNSLTFLTIIGYIIRLLYTEFCTSETNTCSDSKRQDITFL